jgi:hypothetical protein
MSELRNQDQDVQGHGTKRPGDTEDVQGHGRITRDTETDDDVEGHGRLRK